MRATSVSRCTTATSSACSRRATTRGARRSSRICSPRSPRHATPRTPLETAMTLAILHEPAARRFAADVGGKTAYITYRELDPKLLELDHTYVPPERRGGGV